MKPIAILQREPSQGPGYLRQVLREQGLPHTLLHATEGEPLPERADGFAGLVLLGSNHSANEEQLPWVRAELALLRDAIARGVPVLGHCFGAQLLARALGARVQRNARAQIGWSRLWTTPGAGRALFDGATRPWTFNWHYEGFEIPRGAQRLLFGRHSLNKGFAAGPHLGLQCHLEITPESLRAWCGEAELLRDLGPRCALLHQGARAVYRHWLEGLERPLSLAVQGPVSRPDSRCLILQQPRAYL